MKRWCRKRWCRQKGVFSASNSPFFQRKHAWAVQRPTAQPAITARRSARYIKSAPSGYSLSDPGSDMLDLIAGRLHRPRGRYRPASYAPPLHPPQKRMRCFDCFMSRECRFLRECFRHHQFNHLSNSSRNIPDYVHIKTGENQFTTGDDQFTTGENQFTTGENQFTTRRGPVYYSFRRISYR